MKHSMQSMTTGTINLIFEAKSLKLFDEFTVGKNLVKTLIQNQKYTRIEQKIGLRILSRHNL